MNLFTVAETELLELIENGENTGIDFKRYVLANCRRAKALSFSNFEDGMLFFGVNSGALHQPLESACELSPSDQRSQCCQEFLVER